MDRTVERRGRRWISREGDGIPARDGRAWPFRPTLSGVQHGGTAHPLRRKRDQLLSTVSDGWPAPQGPIGVRRVAGSSRTDRSPGSSRTTGRAVSRTSNELEAHDASRDGGSAVRRLGRWSCWPSGRGLRCARSTEPPGRPSAVSLPDSDKVAISLEDSS